MPLIIRSARDFITTPWRNGLGSTTELWREDAATPAGFFWRISRAQVPDSGPFSEFPGVDRWLMLLAGDGFTLDIGRRRERLTERHGMISFPGDVPTACTLIGGACEDLNIMVARDMGGAKVALHKTDTHTTAASRSIFIALEGEWSINLAGGHYNVPENGVVLLTGEDGAPLSLSGNGAMAQVDIS